MTVELARVGKNMDGYITPTWITLLITDCGTETQWRNLYLYEFYTTSRHVCREKLMLPATNKNLAQLSEAKVFSKLSIAAGFWQNNHAKETELIVLLSLYSESTISSNGSHVVYIYTQRNFKRILFLCVKTCLASFNLFMMHYSMANQART